MLGAERFVYRNMTNLFISAYNEKEPARRKELHTCLINNLKSGCFDAVWVIAEADNGSYDYLPDVSPYVVNLLPCNVRPTFETFFNAINTVSGVDDINVIANSDIYFDEILVKPLPHQCFALTRYEVEKNGAVRFLNRSDSQDCWFWNGHIRKPAYCAFTPGVPGCDNRLALELMRAGYEVTNPSLTIKSYHLHANPTNHAGKAKVNPPYFRPVPIAI